MGAWGPGILQNDSAQDSLVDCTHELRDALVQFVDSPQEDDWQRLFAVVGLLMQFSPYTLDPDNEESRLVARAIEAHRSGGAAGRELNEVFDAICNGDVPDYTMATFSPELGKALHDEGGHFAMQKTWAEAPKRCFAFAKSKAFLQQYADRRVERVEASFSTPGVLEDLNRCGYAMGDFALLLILDDIVVDPTRFETWRSAWREARQYEDPGAIEFFDRYYACVETGFNYAINKFTR